MLSRVKIFTGAYCKRILAVNLAFLFAFLQALGINFDIGGVYDSLFDWFAYDFAYSTEKIEAGDTLGRDKTFEMKLAKNEREGCQFILRERTGNESATVSFSDFVNEKGDVLASEVFIENYLTVGKNEHYFYGNYPDALRPYAATEREYARHENNVFYIEVKSGKDTPAGTYKATITVTTDDEKQNLEIPVTATVWDFTLPDVPATETAVGLNGSIFPLAGGVAGSWYGTNTWLTFYDGSVTLTPEQERVYKQYYDFLLEHGLCANFLPYDLLDPRADAYMSDPRVTAFCIPYPKTDDAKLVRYYTKVTSNPEWAAKGYFYPVDEPFDSSRVANYNVIVERLGRLCPGYNMVTPFSEEEKTDDKTGEHLPEFEMQRANNTIICPISRIYRQNKKFRDEMTKLIADGKRSWWYVCCAPGDDTGYCNLFTYQDGIKHRMLFWQQVSYGVTGFLYYDTGSWGFAGNPWLNSKTHLEYDTSGDGCLLYPGRYIGYDGAVASLRLKGVANGLEDTTYLKLARDIYGDKWVDARIALVTRSVTDYTSSDKLLETVRRSIGDALDKAM